MLLQWFPTRMGDVQTSPFLLIKAPCRVWHDAMRFAVIIDVLITCFECGLSLRCCRCCLLFCFVFLNLDGWVSVEEFSENFLNSQSRNRLTYSVMLERVSELLFCTTVMLIIFGCCHSRLEAAQGIVGNDVFCDGFCIVLYTFWCFHCSRICKFRTTCCCVRCFFFFFLSSLN